MNELVKEIKKEVHKVVVGQERMVDSLLIGLFCNGHILLEGVPGLAKTTTVNTLAKALGLNFKRVQFTPDLLPSDILGAEIYDPKNNDFKIKKGPIFTNLLLADEINRAPAKVQSALLEVMQERQVTIGDESFAIDKPFLVLATQNPVEQEGAYSLPEAQLDRFMLKVVVGYNTKEEEKLIARRVANNTFEAIDKSLSKADIDKIKEQILNVHIDSEIEEYITDLIFASREPKKYALDEIAPYIQYGASPRATIDMVKAVRAVAFLEDSEHVTPMHIARIAKDILRHRIIITYEAEAEGITSDYIVDKILQTVAIP